MGVFNLIAFLGACVLAFAGWGAHDWVDHHAVDYTVPAPVRWVLPAGLKRVQMLGSAVARDRALAQIEIDVADVKACRADQRSLQAAVAAQNAAVAALGRESAARVAQSAKAAQSARAVAESYRRSADAILAQTPSGPDHCEAARRLIVTEAGR